MNIERLHLLRDHLNKIGQVAPSDRVFSLKYLCMPIETYIQEEIDNGAEEEELRETLVDCKTVCCACGELPNVFPEYWRLEPMYFFKDGEVKEITRWELEFISEHPRYSNEFDDVMEFFDISSLYFNILFMPECARDVINIVLDRLCKDPLPTFIEDVTQPEHVAWNIDVLIELSPFIKENIRDLYLGLEEYEVYESGIRD